jgi:hypothetical protein
MQENAWPDEEGRFAVKPLTPAVHSPGERLTFWQWGGRALAGLGLGCIWSSLVSLAWIGFISAASGSLERALRQQKHEPWGVVLSVTFMATAVASFLGGLIGPLALGAAGRMRRPVLSSSAWGGASGAVLGVAVGLLAGWASWEYAPRTLLCLLLPLGLSVPAGLLGGWLGGRVIARAWR